ncbi:MAG TPA: GNAT family N-acetyltransferase [Thermoanaerobaculia bacterium]|nr:GNAT family N-acetyltransferase [Thermoanaerobaculia bacterium]
MRWKLRPASAGDRHFLFRLHETTMRDVIESTWGWNEEWQRADFEKRFQESFYFMVEVDDISVGTLCVERRPDCFYILELQLLPAYQGLGIGSEVVRTIIRDAAAEHLAVELSVVPANTRARRLYERLGFEVTHVDPPFIRMSHSGKAV